MSHVAKVHSQIKDLNALDQALRNKFPGAALAREKKSFRMYGSETQPCVHAITVPGTKYEVGLRWKSTDKAQGFELHRDPFDGSTDRVFGAELIGLNTEYNAVVAENAMRAKGRMVRRQIDTPQHVRLVAI